MKKFSFAGLGVFFFVLLLIFPVFVGPTIVPAHDEQPLIEPLTVSPAVSPTASRTLQSRSVCRKQKLNRRKRFCIQRSGCRWITGVHWTQRCQPITPAPTPMPSAQPTDQCTAAGIITQKDALLDLKAGFTNGETELDDWDSTTEPCSGSTSNWSGIFCNSDSEVTEIQFNGKNLTGTISPFLGCPTSTTLVSSLTRLDFYGNRLEGTIPTELGLLTGLQYLRLDGNRLDGTIPLELGVLTDLQYLGFEDNNLTGTIPTELGNMKRLIGLLLDGNSLEGILPSEICGLQNKRLLFLQIDCTPKVICDCCTSVHWTQRCQPITPAPTPMPSTQTTDQCAAAGIITQKDALLALKAGFTNGETELGDWDSTTEPCFRSTSNWSGIICNSSSEVTKIACKGKNLTGTISPLLGCPTTLVSTLTHLDFYGNRLDGTIPTEFGGLNGLEYLYLADNNLTGTIPSELGKLTRLINLFLDGNSIEGILPLEICALRDNELLVLWADCPPKVICDCCTNICPCIEAGINTQKDALLALKEGLTNGASVFLSLSSWDSNTDPCDDGWFGISCSISGDVTEIKMSSLSLDGTISPLIGCPTTLVTSLTYLSFAENKLTGSIPTEIGSLTSLTHVNFWTNTLTGSIPTNIGSLTSLTYLDLGTNALSGTIPTQIGSLSSLTNLWIDNNNLDGAMPPEICTLLSGSLVSLIYDTDEVIGCFPCEFINTQKDALLALKNGLIGNDTTKLPNWDSTTDPCDGWFGIICSSSGYVTEINIYFDQPHEQGLSGTISPLIGCPTTLVTSLKILMLSRRPEVQNTIHGSIPTEIGSLTSLTVLKLSYNNLTGSIPTEIGSLTSLTYLDFASNSLTGSIPTEIGFLSTSLTGLFLALNSLTGAIPTEIGSLSSLTGLFLEINNLTGSMPTEICALPSLNELVFDFDKVEGCL